jgi:hypothetical protein
MRILFDIVHPAHVHFFKHMMGDLRARGHETAIVAREKDVTSALLDHYGLAHETVGRPSKKGRRGQLVELVRRDLTLAKRALLFGADVVVTRNPAGVQAARLIRRVGIFDTDDGSAAGIHFKAARPFAHWLTSPDCLPEYWGRRHIKYPGYKQSTYLHPDHFTPDARVLNEMGVGKDEPFFVVRFVAMDASHDSGETGMSLDVKREMIARLQKKGRVFLSVEGGKVPAEWALLAYKLAPHRLHDLLAFAQIVVGDSQTMAAEAAFLGTPALRASTFAGRISYLEELEHKYGLTWAYHPRDGASFLQKLDELLARGRDLRASIAPGRERMLREKVNIAKWFTEFILEKGARG